MSWEWQYTWWQIFGSKFQLELVLLAITDEDGQLVGIAPLFKSKIRHKRLLKIERIGFIGNCWRSHVTMRTEKIDFIFKKDMHEQLLEEVFSWLFKNLKFDEFIISDLLVESISFQYLRKNRTFRIAEQYDSWYLDTSGNYESWLKGLGKNTRLQVFNRRKKLEKEGQVEIKYYNDCIDECFDILNRLHKKRWDGNAFQNDRLEFNKRVAKLLSEKKSLHFVVLYVNNEPESIQYNYRVNGNEYNIQAGFNPDFGKKIPLGYLKFGYAIENAFASAMARYDFLAGEGKNTQYKSRLTNSCEKVVDIQIVKNRLLALVYKVYDFIKK